MSYLFEPNTICPTLGADKVFRKIAGIEPVYICARTCDYSLMFHRLETSLEPIQSVILDDQDIIKGEVETKIQTLVYRIVEQKSPKVILLISTCLPQLIGLSLKNLAKKLSAKTCVPVITRILKRLTT